MLVETRPDLKVAGQAADGMAAVLVAPALTRRTGLVTPGGNVGGLP
jgi:hypothetical protein